MAIYTAVDFASKLGILDAIVAFRAVSLLSLNFARAIYEVYLTAFFASSSFGCSGIDSKEAPCELSIDVERAGQPAP